jgi:helix-turn-helix protein
MTKSHNKTGRSIKPERYVMLMHWMLKSEAWNACNAVERAIYLLLALRYNGQNNGTISLSVREIADNLKIGKTTASMAIKGLVEKGFIVVMKKGAFSRKCRHATEWRLTEYPCHVTGARASREYMRWNDPKHGSGTGTNGTSGETERSRHEDRAS